MAKNKISSERLGYIQSLSYNELGKGLTSGEFSLKELRQAYAQMRDVAVKRIKRITTEKNIKQFGKPNLYKHGEDGDYFRETRNIITSNELLREISDVSSFLKSKRSTVTGLKKTRNALIERMSEAGFNVDNSEYLKLVKFLKWFKASEFSKIFDSDHPVTAQVWNMEKASEEDWRKAFEEFARLQEQEPAPVRKY